MVVEGSNFQPPASANQVAALRQLLPGDTPSDYFDFLARADGAQVWFDGDGLAGFDCLRIYSISRMLALRESLSKLIPWLLVIGGDQGSQFLGYDMSRSTPWPIVMFLPGCGPKKVATSFSDLAERYFVSVGEAVKGEHALSKP